MQIFQDFSVSKTLFYMKIIGQTGVLRTTSMIPTAFGDKRLLMKVKISHFLPIDPKKNKLNAGNTRSTKHLDRE